MKKSYFITAIATLVLSLELYGLKLLQLIDQVSGSCWADAWQYAREVPVELALALTVLVLAYGIYSMFKEK